MGCCGSMGWMAWMMLPALIGALALLLGVLAAIALAVGWSLRLGRPARGPERPLDVLQGRYARGEINGEQFEEMKRRLSV